MRALVVSMALLLCPVAALADDQADCIKSCDDVAKMCVDACAKKAKGNTAGCKQPCVQVGDGCKKECKGNAPTAPQDGAK